MKIIWQVDAEDAAKVKALVEQHQHSPFVKDRISSNLRDDKPPVTKDYFWYVLVGCLLTTRQRSGPDSPVARFLKTKPFPLEFAICRQHAELADFTQKTLAEFGGLRRSTTIGKEVAANLQFLEHGGWEQTFEHLDCVRLNSQPDTERQAAQFVDQHFKGFGPKQSRNLLQWLGLPNNFGKRRSGPIGGLPSNWACIMPPSPASAWSWKAVVKLSTAPTDSVPMAGFNRPGRPWPRCSLGPKTGRGEWKRRP